MVRCIHFCIFGLMDPVGLLGSCALDNAVSVSGPGTAVAGFGSIGAGFLLGASGWCTMLSVSRRGCGTCTPTDCISCCTSAETAGISDSNSSISKSAVSKRNRLFMSCSCRALLALSSTCFATCCRQLARCTVSRCAAKRVSRHSTYYSVAQHVIENGVSLMMHIRCSRREPVTKPTPLLCTTFRWLVCPVHSTDNDGLLHTRNVL